MHETNRTRKPLVKVGAQDKRHLASRLLSSSVLLCAPLLFLAVQAVVETHSFHVALHQRITLFFYLPSTIAGDSTNILLNFTMLMLLIHTYTPCVDYSPYQANVFSDVIMCFTTSCVSDATLHVRIQSSTKTFVRSTLLLSLEKP